MRKNSAFVAVAAVLCLMPARAEAPAKPDVQGVFSIIYQPIYCVKAPCPPGTYAIIKDKAVVVNITHLESDMANAPEISAAIASARDMRHVTLEGEVFVERRTATAHIIASRIVPEK